MKMEDAVTSIKRDIKRLYSISDKLAGDPGLSLEVRSIAARLENEISMTLQASQYAENRAQYWKNLTERMFYNEQ